MPKATQEATQFKFSHIAANDVRLHVAEAGPPDGPLLFLLHGFPDYWYGWRKQIEPLAVAGYRVVAPDQRGYGLSAKPRGIAAYSLDRLAGDIVALADHYGAERFFVAGHDWGAMVGWWLAFKAPARLAKLMAISAGHPAVWKARMKRDPEQRKLSRYVRFLQLPMLPEAVLRARGYDALARAISETERKGSVGASDLQHYREAWAQPGALTAMINWYRAFGRQNFHRPTFYRVDVPVEMIWGAHDPYGTAALGEDSIALCAQGRLAVFDKATHWVPIDEPERTLEHMRQFFGT